jgi:putative oxidoreductase
MWAVYGGYELPLLYAVVAAAMVLTGPGWYSNDGVIGLPAPDWVGFAAVDLSCLCWLASCGRVRKGVLPFTTVGRPGRRVRRWMS